MSIICFNNNFGFGSVRFGSVQQILVSVRLRFGRKNWFQSAPGRYLKNINQSTLKSCIVNIPLVIDGGWLIHQLNSFKGCENYSDVTKELIPINRK